MLDIEPGEADFPQRLARLMRDAGVTPPTVTIEYRGLGVVSQGPRCLQGALFPRGQRRLRLWLQPAPGPPEARPLQAFHLGAVCPVRQRACLAGLHPPHAHRAHAATPCPPCRPPVAQEADALVGEGSTPTLGNAFMDLLKKATLQAGRAGGTREAGSTAQGARGGLRCSRTLLAQPGSACLQLHALRGTSAY